MASMSAMYDQRRLLLGAVFFGVAAMVGAACATDPPRLIDIDPASGPAGDAYPLMATIRGSGFMASGNIIDFGSARVADVPSETSSRITFSIPKSTMTPGGAPPFVLPPGEYSVTVTMRTGTSNALKFVLTRGP